MKLPLLNCVFKVPMVAHIPTIAITLDYKIYLIKTVGVQTREVTPGI